MAYQSRSLRLDQSAMYQIQVQGRLDAGWSSWFDDLTVTVTSQDGGLPTTTLTGWVRDQVALHSLLVHIRYLGLPLLLVRCLDVQSHSDAGPHDLNEKDRHEKPVTGR
jgi:hypothetical protein